MVRPLVKAGSLIFSDGTHGIILQGYLMLSCLEVWLGTWESWDQGRTAAVNFGGWLPVCLASDRWRVLGVGCRWGRGVGVGSLVRGIPVSREPEGREPTPPTTKQTRQTWVGF